MKKTLSHSHHIPSEGRGWKIINYACGTSLSIYVSSINRYGRRTQSTSDPYKQTQVALYFRCSDGTLEGGRSLSSSLFSSVGDETLTLQAAGSQAADTDDDGTALVSYMFQTCPEICC